MTHPREEVQKVKELLKSGDKQEAIEHLDYLIHGLQRQDGGESLNNFINDLKKIKTNAMVDMQAAVKACDELLQEINRNLGPPPTSISSSDYEVEDTVGGDTGEDDTAVIKGSDISVADQEHIEEEIERLQEDIMFLEQRLDEVEDD